LNILISFAHSVYTESISIPATALPFALDSAIIAALVLCFLDLLFPSFGLDPNPNPDPEALAYASNALLVTPPLAVEVVPEDHPQFSNTISAFGTIQLSWLTRNQTSRGKTSTKTTGKTC
jgi:hypothetical protein